MELRAKGFTATGRIDFLGVHGIDQALEFEYRPVMPDEFDAIRKEVDRADAKGEGTAARIKLMHTRVVDWNVEQEGKPVDVSQETMSLIPPPFVERLYNIVMGWSISDTEKN